MNFYLEQAAEEIDQAISDADQLQALIKATIQKLTNYLKRRQQEKLERRYLQNANADDSQSVRIPDKQTYNQIKILEFFNKLHKEADKQFRELKEMIPSNPQTFVMIEDNNELEPSQKQQELKPPQKVPENKLYPIFKSTQNGGQMKLGQIPQPIVTKPEEPPKPKQPEKEAQFTYGRLQKFQYQKLKYPTKSEGNCVFCGLEANEQNLGPLLLVPSKKDSNQFSLHEMCGLWSQNLVFHNGAGYCDPDQIDEEVEKSKKTKCFLCSRSGATLCCAVCPQAFHFTCLMKSSSTGKLVEEEFKFFCDKHKHKIKDENKKSKPKIKLNQSKAKIKTSPKRSPRKSPKRGKSPASQVILRYVFANEDSKPSEGTMWQQQQIQHHIECKLEPQEQ